LAERDRQLYLGWLLVALSALAFSSAGFFTRLITEDVWTILFWRSVFSGFAMAVIAALQYRGRMVSTYRELGPAGLLVSLTAAGGMIAFVGALRLTSVADVYVIYATVPFVTAAIAWFVLSERISWSVLIASAVALIGVVLTVSGAKFGGSLVGQFVAFIMTVLMALMTVILGRRVEIALVPALAVAAWMTAFVTFWLSSPLEVSAFDLGMLALFGIAQNALALILYGSGSRLIPSAEATLLTALDVPLSPLWVWLAFGETASRYTVIGGALVMTAVFGHIVYEMRKTPEIPTSGAGILRTRDP
jgi:drug/metabolite transporter (DMT)-like permease